MPALLQARDTVAALINCGRAPITVTIFTATELTESRQPCDVIPQNQQVNVVCALVGDYTFQVHSSEDAYEIFAADFAVDKDLDVWLLQIYKDTVAYGDEYDLMLGDYYFLLEKSHQMLYGAYLTLIEIWNKQQAGMDILPLENAGLWELIVADPWSYVYEGYKRRKKPRTCKVRKSKYDHEYLVDDPQRETDPPLLQF